MSNVHFHPNDDILLQHACGDLSPASSIMISAHVELCPHCRQRLEDIEQHQASVMVSSESEDITPDLQAMMQHIMSQETETSTPVETEKTTTIMLGDKAFHLPHALQRHSENIGPWSRLPGNIKRAQVTVGGQSKMNFIYMDSDSALPEHTHQGNEITLVLAGEFYDEQGTYRPGDFILQTDEHKHVPKTREGQDCLCLTLLDAPLHFTSGLATLLNPFSQLFFR
ncbi:transcriptional activator ChrR [Photobacterium sanctipauli]|uniref:Transcriptional activator ChrR n=1 Tax=Photobacterium sanctipauli TaxID=1342794 RepID=A0A2T3NBN4_9GAMM|nr:ChrR family anti-sigma-E factor [Photobacterium sanctipauli]PSW11351.1 transcriptional activator ChrR [Photobacterium sanctipauli]